MVNGQSFHVTVCGTPFLLCSLMGVGNETGSLKEKHTFLWRYEFTSRDDTHTHTRTPQIINTF